jgi:hypothetical protein
MGRKSSGKSGETKNGLILGLATVILLLTIGVAHAEEPKRLEFTRMCAHWTNYAEPEYLEFIRDAKIEVAQVGFYGAHYWSLSHTKEGAGYPAHFPVVGLAENADFLAKLNQEVHDRGAKVVGHFNVELVCGDPAGSEAGGEQGTGFFLWYRTMWDEKLLGPRPIEDPMGFMQRKADGSPHKSEPGSFGAGKMSTFNACLSNPHWRAVLKAWVKAAIERGVDGLVANYFYRHDCVCPFCQDGFKKHLAGHFKPEEIKAKFGIEDLASHRFAEIVGWHDPKETTPLRLEMLKWSQTSCKEAFDDVWGYGRKLKPGFIAAQWNHLGNFNQINGDERSMLPPEVWGKGEDYLWYSTGGAACYTDLANGYLGEGTLQARYIRGAFEDKPFTLGKYESTRIRVAIAELAANGGSPMGFYTNFKDPMAREEIVRYYGFLARHERLFKANKAHEEAWLEYPRWLVHQGKVEAIESFRRIGDELLDQHILFSVTPQDSPEEMIRRHPTVRVFKAKIEMPGDKPAERRWEGASRFEAPTTVRVSASIPADGRGLTVHFVNYNRMEPEKPKSPGSGIKDEKPIPSPAIKASLVLPKGMDVQRVVTMTPEEPEPAELQATRKGDRLEYTAPEFLVYRVVQVE